jgi:hypothetical protein
MFIADDSEWEKSILYCVEGRGVYFEKIRPRLTPGGGEGQRCHLGEKHEKGEEKKDEL